METQKKGNTRKEYFKKYSEENRDKANIKQKRYQLKHKEAISKRRKEIYQKDKPKFIEKAREYRENNREKVNLSARKRYWANLEKSSLSNKKNYQKHKKSYNARKNEQFKERRLIDKNFSIKCRLRIKLNKAIKKYSEGKKIISAIDYGIKYLEIIKYLKPFPEDLSEYHIDHIRPLCSFDLTDPEQVKEAFAPENHQWLTIEQNLRKGGKWNGS